MCLTINVPPYQFFFLIYPFIFSSPFFFLRNATAKANEQKVLTVPGTEPRSFRPSSLTKWQVWLPGGARLHGANMGEATAAREDQTRGKKPG